MLAIVDFRFKTGFVYIFLYLESNLDLCEDPEKNMRVLKAHLKRVAHHGMILLHSFQKHSLQKHSFVTIRIVIYAKTSNIITLYYQRKTYFTEVTHNPK